MTIRYTTEGNVEMATLPRADLDALIRFTLDHLTDAAESLSDLLAAEQIKRDVAEGREELIPGGIVDRLLDGEEVPLRVWREHRGLSQAELARRSGVKREQIVQIEGSHANGSAGTLRKLAEALGVTIDELIPVEIDE